MNQYLYHSVSIDWNKEELIWEWQIYYITIWTTPYLFLQVRTANKNTQLFSLSVYSETSPFFHTKWWQNAFLTVMLIHKGIVRMLLH